MPSPIFHSWIAPLIFACIAAFTLPQNTLGQEASPTKSKKRPQKGYVWNMGFTLFHHQLKDESDHENEFIGNGAVVQLGIGHLFSEWFLLSSIDINLGPFESVRSEEIKTDFTGTGLSVFTAYNFSPGPLRKGRPSFGPSFCLRYSDLVGRSIEHGASASDGSQIENYTMRITSLTAEPGIFIAWLKRPRIDGNTPDLLMTRMEGYFVNLAVSFPLLANYRANYDTKFADNPAANRKDLERGQLKGMSFLLSFNPLLGI